MENWKMGLGEQSSKRQTGKDVNLESKPGKCDFIEFKGKYNVKKIRNYS